MKGRNRTCPYCGATLDPGEKCNCVSNIIDLDLFIPEPGADEKGKKLSQYELYLKWRQREALKVKTSCGVNIS